MEKKRVYLKPDRVKKHIWDRREELLLAKKFLERESQKHPDGFLKIQQRKGCYQYTHIKDQTARYIKKDQHILARKLAQKSYEKSVLKEIEKQIHMLETISRQYEPERIDQKFEQLYAERKTLVEPIVLSDEEFRSRWESMEYNGKYFDEDTPQYYTEKNERVRSKSEVIIASRLTRQNIPYHYEYPMILSDYLTIYPDFTCLNMRTRAVYIWEHFGMMDIPEYAEKAIKKINTYIENQIYPGINLILTFETSKQPLNTQIVDKIIQTYLL